MSIACTSPPCPQILFIEGSALKKERGWNLFRFFVSFCLETIKVIKKKKLIVLFRNEYKRNCGGAVKFFICWDNIYYVN